LPQSGKRIMKICITCGMIFCLAGLCLTLHASEGDEMNDQKTKPMIAVYAVDGLLKLRKDASPDQVADFLEDHGINAVFGGYENPEFLAACRKKKIRVFTDLVCFVGGRHWHSHPESRPINADAKPIEKEEWYSGVCPNQKWLRQDLLEKAASLVKTHQLDGVWMDFIRYPCHWEMEKPKLYQSCFCDTCTRLFEKETGIKIPEEVKKDKKQTADYILKNHGEKWSEWKCERIAGFVKQVSKLVKRENPAAMVGLFGLPWRNDEFGGAIKDVVGQDFSLLARSGVDIFSPMAYHKMCYRDVPWIARTSSYFKGHTQKEVMPIIQACSVPSEMKEEEFIDAVRHSLIPPSSGVILFHASHIEKESRWPALKKALGD